MSTTAAARNSSSLSMPNQKFKGMPRSAARDLSAIEHNYNRKRASAHRLKRSGTVVRRGGCDAELGIR